MRRRRRTALPLHRVAARCRHRCCCQVSAAPLPSYVNIGSSKIPLTSSLRPVDGRAPPPVPSKVRPSLQVALRTTKLFQRQSRRCATRLCRERRRRVRRWRVSCKIPPTPSHCPIHPVHHHNEVDHRDRPWDGDGTGDRGGRTRPSDPHWCWRTEQEGREGSERRGCRRYRYRCRCRCVGPTEQSTEQPHCCRRAGGVEQEANLEARGGRHRPPQSSSSMFLTGHSRLSCRRRRFTGR